MSLMRLVPGARLELTHQESKSCALPVRLSGSIDARLMALATL